MSELNRKLAYVVGDSYSELSQLPGVLTATQFFKSVIDGSLPLDLTWMAGQGLSSVERNLLQLCKMYCAEIEFKNADVFEDDDSAHSAFLSTSSNFPTIFSKLSRMLMALLQVSKKSMYRLSSFSQ